MAEDLGAITWKPAVPAAQVPKIPEPFLIEQIATLGGFVHMWGIEGIGKTRFMWQLASAISAGRDFFGMKIPKPGPVLFLELDMPPTGMSILRDNWAARGETEAGIYLNQDRMLNFSLTDEHHGRDAAQWLYDQQRKHHFVAVIIDTFYRVYSVPPGGDANAIVLRAWSALQTSMPDVTLFAMNHSRRAGANAAEAGVRGRNYADYLGPGAINRAADTEFRLAEHFDKETGDGKITLHMQKNRFVPPWKALPVEMDEYGFFGIRRNNLSGPEAVAIAEHLIGEPNPGESMRAYINRLALATNASPAKIRAAVYRLRGAQGDE